MADREWSSRPHCQILRLGDAGYPALLAGITDAPPKLYVLGNVDTLHLPAIAIVGSRNPTSAGRRNATEFARCLAGAGFCIVSGLAEGIDTAAHEGALCANGATIAFLGHGIDRVYPAKNAALAKKISAGGALCSEFPLGSPPRRQHFPRRNRLISGLCAGTLVVEAARRSGSLISARLAGEQGREVFAIPGSIHNPLSRGCHKLIRDGAKLVENARDIVEELAPLLGQLMQNSADTHSETGAATMCSGEHIELLRALSHDAMTADELASHCGLTIDRVSYILLHLELEGKVDAQAGGRYSRQH